MDHQFFVEMELAFRQSFNGVGRSGLGGVLNADALETGMAYTGFVAALAPYYKDALINDDKTLQNRINDAIEEHYELMSTDHNSDEYLKLSKSALEAFEKITK